jgi:hypothetical protein
MSISVFHRIQAAYQAECRSQLGKLQDEIYKTEKIAGPDNTVVLAAKAFVAET